MKTLKSSEVGDRHSQFCILDEAGEIVAEARIRKTVQALREHFTRWASSRVVLEGGTSSAWRSRLASTAGHAVTLTSADARFGPDAAR
jgi:transposase